MKTASRLLPLFAAAYLFAFGAPPLDPGAKAVDELNHATKSAGQNGVSYNTFDPFEKVYAFYKSKGTEVQTHPLHGPAKSTLLCSSKKTGMQSPSFGKTTPRTPAR